MKPLRVAFCTDTFEECNGVATVSRQYLNYARRHNLPFLLVRPGPVTQSVTDGNITIIDLAKSPLCIPLDMGLRFDTLVARHYGWLKRQLLDFQPDLVHITGPGDIGMLSATLSHALIPAPNKVPLVASWHTNLHQYARMRWRVLPASCGDWIEKEALHWAAKFYKMARLTLAPNDDILKVLHALNGRTGRRMPHGVDVELFHPPAKPNEAETLTLGYVGRLTSEKNVNFLAKIAATIKNVKFLIVGDGKERAWLEQKLPNATFTGILRGEALADAYRRMDVFLFPSKTDTFGLVMLEAMATGLPVVAFSHTGPKCAVTDQVSGFTAVSDEHFIAAAQRLIEDRQLRKTMSRAAYVEARCFSWDAVFDSMHESYELLPSLAPGALLKPAPASIGSA